MILTCSRCLARYRFDETRMGAGSGVVRCRKCRATIEVVRPDPSPAGTRAVPVPGPPSPEEAGSPPDRPRLSFRESPGAGRPESAVRTRAARRTALLADEPREFRDFVQEALQAAGYEVSLTDNGEEALLLAGSHPFDLILLNAYLHRLLGLHVCQRIKADPALKGTPVILMGALLGPGGGDRPPEGRYGADDFIPNTLRREELASRIGRFSPEGSSRPVSPPASPRGIAPAPPPSGEGASIPAEGRPGPDRSSKALTGDEAEIHRLARIMISDIEIYHPEKFSRALREGTFFEAFSDELGRGKDLIDRRFGHLANRIQLLAAGLRDSLEAYRGGGAPRRASHG